MTHPLLLAAALAFTTGCGRVPLGNGGADADGDGFVSSADGGPDCNDTDPSIHPDAEEICDGIDNNCNGQTDERVLLVSYADSDGDGYGDPSTPRAGCDTEVAPRVFNRDDCDDTNANVHPGADEVCDGLDNNCDGDIDSDAIDPTTYFSDVDGDGFGDPATALTSCEAPDAAWTTTGGDCDDDDPDISPDTVWYRDADSDGYGAIDDSTQSCEAPAGYVSDSTDCDDDDPLTHPGAHDWFVNNVDNDCDTQVDEDRRLGSGKDGVLHINNTFLIDQDRSNHRVHPDGVAYAVHQLDSHTIYTSSAPHGIEAGDEVLLINLHGSLNDHDFVGSWEVAEVVDTSSIPNAGGTITVSAPLSNTYAEAGNTNLTDQTVLVQRIPHYQSVLIDNGGELTTSHWDFETGGIVALRAHTTFEVRSGGVVHADGRGYHGGTPFKTDNCDGPQGESYAQEGVGQFHSVNGCAPELYTNYNSDNELEAYLPNFGAGGTYLTGGGGNYAGGATDGEYPTNGKNGHIHGKAGNTYGSSDLSVMFFGSGGGGTWSGDKPGNNPGPSGDGGGIVFLSAHGITTHTEGAIRSNGTSTHYYSVGTYVYGTSSGAGGSVWLAAESLNLVKKSVQAMGGTSVTPDTVDGRNGIKGGNGGKGRIRLDWNQLDNPDENEAAEPDPGHTGTF